MRLTIFGGKGGVGKTSCACSAALHFARSGKKTLLLSADPAHSLSDRLNQQIGNQICAVTGVNSLSAIEIDAEQAFIDFKEQYADQIKGILTNSTYLDDSDISELYELTIPGLDEVITLTTMLEYIDRDKFDRYILDTAPTGHALRLLQLPNVLDQWIKMLAKLRLKYIYIVSRFSRNDQIDVTDDFLFNLKRSIKKLYSLLKDPDRCHFVVVTNAEQIVFEETKRLIKNLMNMQIPVTKILINRVFADHPSDCEVCHQKKEAQRYYIQEIRRTFAEFKIYEIPELLTTQQGITFLKNIHIQE